MDFICVMLSDKKIFAVKLYVAGMWRTGELDRN